MRVAPASWGSGSSSDVVGLMVSAVPNAACAVLAALPAALAGRTRREAARERGRSRYRLLEEVGSAGPGTTWRAAHDALDEPVCVRIVRPTDLTAVDPTRANAVLQRSARAVGASRRVRSPHAIAVLRSRIEDDAFHCVTEWVEGFDLDTLVREHGPLPAERVVYLLGQVCHALHDAHVHGVVHGDLRPGHVTVTVRGIEPDFVKVGGFGLATTAVGAGPVPSDDLHALGTLAQWMLTGTTVSEGTTVDAEPSPTSHHTATTIDPALERIVLQCLEEDPRRRPASARQVGSALAATGLAPQWTEDVCRQWWEAHAPHLLPPRPETGSDRAERAIVEPAPRGAASEPDFFRRRAGKRRVPPSETDQG